MRQKRVKELRKIFQNAKIQSLSWKNFKKEYKNLPWNERNRFVNFFLTSQTVKPV